MQRNLVGLDIFNHEKARVGVKYLEKAGLKSETYLNISYYVLQYVYAKILIFFKR